MSADAVTPDHTCPHCAEAKAIADQLRPMLSEAHALIARLRAITGEHEPHVAGPQTDAITSAHRTHA